MTESHESLFKIQIFVKTQLQHLTSAARRCPRMHPSSILSCNNALIEAQHEHAGLWRKFEEARLRGTASASTDGPATTKTLTNTQGALQCTAMVPPMACEAAAMGALLLGS